MKKPYIKTVNSNTSTVLADSIVPIDTTLTTGYCKDAIELVGNTVVIKDCYVNGYLVIVNATFTVPVIGDVILQVLQNGNDVIGGSATVTVGTATTEINTISFSTIIKSTSGNINDVISLLNSGVGATFTNIEFDIIKI